MTLLERLSDIEKVLIACAIFLAPVIGMMIWNHYKMAGVEAEKALVRCEEAEDTALCKEGVEARGGDCFGETRKGGGKFTQSHTDIRAYDYCVRYGVEAMKEKRKEWRAERYR